LPPNGRNVRLYNRKYLWTNFPTTTKTSKMKKILFSSLIVLFIVQAASAQYRTERSGYEGDYFSLEGALELFQDARNLRDFERSLNTRDSWVNNLDLDYDGRTDYIRVEHRRQGNFHLIILQAIVDRYEVQDVAVIEIERIRRGDAVLQIIGDEDLYGREVFVEPVIGYANSRRGNHTDYGEYANVYYWPIVQYLLGPQYRQVYVSPYRYQYYPTWWSAWRPVTWNVFRPRIVVYTRYFRVAPRLRVVRAHQFYRPFRAYSYNVVLRSNRVRIRQGRPPINRPRYNNRNRFNDRGRDFRGRPNAVNTDRGRVAESRRPDRVRTSPATTPDRRRADTRRVSPSNRTPRNVRVNPSSERRTSSSPSRRVGSSSRSNQRMAPGRTPQSRPKVQSRSPRTSTRSVRTVSTRRSDNKGSSQVKRKTRTAAPRKSVSSSRRTTVKRKKN